MSTDSERFLGIAPDNKDNQQRCKPVMYRTATIFNTSGLLTIVWMFTGFQSPSGMEGMFAALVPFLIGVALMGTGILLNLIGIMRGEPLDNVSKINLAFSFVFGMVVVYRFLTYS